MCRWMAYSGDPILAEDLLFRPAHSLIDQSLHATRGDHHQWRRVRRRVVRRPGGAGCLQGTHAGLERPESA